MSLYKRKRIIGSALVNLIIPQNLHHMPYTLSFVIYEHYNNYPYKYLIYVRRIGTPRCIMYPYSIL